MKVQDILHFRGMSQVEIADAIEVTPPRFSLMCRGRAPLPLCKVVPLADVLHASIQDVVLAFNQIRKINDESE
jgi:predicted transcriptional regulator